MDNGGIVLLNPEWDRYRVAELSDPGNIGSATLGNRDTSLLNVQVGNVVRLQVGDGDALQPDGASLFNRNDYQHDTFIFTLDTSAAAWRSLAKGQSLTVQYRVTANETLVTSSESDTLDITLTFVKTCFAADSLIRMGDGSDKRAGDIAVGDLVATADHGAQPVRWVGTNTVLQAEMQHFAKWRPVRISAGALGEGLPATDLLLSQLHRVLVSGAIARKQFGADEVLMPARFLTALDGVEIVDEPADLTYVHFMFDNHEVVWSNGVRCESFLVSPLSRSQIGESQLAELDALFPELGRLARDGSGVPARPFVRGDAALRLAAAHGSAGLALQ